MQIFIKNIILSCLLCLLIVSNLVYLFTQKASAEPIDFVTQTLNEAKQFTVTNALHDCFIDKNGSGLAFSFDSSNVSKSVAIFDSSKGKEGLVGHHVRPSDGRGNCSDGAWVSSALKILGFTNNLDFLNAFYDKNGDNWVLKKDFQLDEAGIKKYPEFTADAFKTFLSVADNGNNTAAKCLRTGCLINPLSDSAKYLLSLRNFVLGCGATPSSLDVDVINSDSKDRVNVNIVDASGKIKTVLYAIDKNLEDTVTVGSGVTNNGKQTCNQLFMQINQLSLPYQQKVTEAINAGQEIGDLNNILSLNKENKLSCGQKTKLSSSWIICGGMELLSSGMDAIMGQVDSLLNVDGSKIENNAKLQLAWGSFRAIASFMLLGVAIVMILAQAMGGGS